MRLQKILLLLVGSFLLVGGASYLFGQKSVEAPSQLSATGEETSQMAQLATAVVEEVKPLSGTGPFKDLKNRNQDLVCEVSPLSSVNGALSGQVYLSGEKVRGYFDIQQAGQLFASNMLIEGNVIYFWTDTPAGKMAFKTNIDDSPASVATDAKSSAPLNLDDFVSYDCQSWQKQDEQFKVPADLKFIDVNSLSV